MKFFSLKYIAYTLLTLVLLGLQFGFFAEFRLGGAVPELVLVAVILLAASAEEPVFIFVAVLGGALQEAMLGVFSGTYLLGYLLAGAAVYTICNRIVLIERRARYFVLFVAGGLCLYWLCAIGYSSFVVRMHWWPVIVPVSSVLVRLTGSLLYSLLLVYPVYWVLLVLERFLDTMSRRRSLPR